MVAVAGLFVRALMRFAPRDFRTGHGQAALDYLHDSHADVHSARGPLAAGLALARQVVGLAWAIGGAWLDDARSEWRQRNRFRAMAPPVQRKTHMLNVVRDLRQVVRSLGRTPGFSAVVVITLGLGIGANAGIFSLVNGVLLKPLPYDEPDDLMAIWTRYLPESGYDLPQFALSVPEFVDYQSQTAVMEDVGIYGTSGATLVDGVGEPERVSGAYMTASVMNILRAQPMLGRSFNEEDSRTGNPRVVLLAHGLWQRRFGGDPNIVGQTINVSGTPREIIGVMPQGFGFPEIDQQLWLPVIYDPASQNGRQAHSWAGIARLSAGRTVVEAQAELEVLMAGWKERFPELYTGHFVITHPLIQDVTEDIDQVLWLLMGAVGLVLLLACANVANLMLARAEARRTEMGVRVALGAGGGRLVQQVLSESVVFAILGGMLGIVVASGVITLVQRMSAGMIPRLENVGVDLTVLGFTGAIVLVTTLLFGAGPAWQAARTDVQQAFRDGGRSVSAGRGRLRVRQSLVLAEIGLGVMLVIGAGLMTKTFHHLLTQETGFDPENVLTMRLSLASDYDAGAAGTFYDQLTEQIGALPGVRSVAAVSSLPLATSRPQLDFLIEGRVPPGPGQPAWNSPLTIVTPGYFETMGIALRRGRTIDMTDRGSSLSTAVVNQSFVRQFFPDEDPLGHRVTFVGVDSIWASIVGVVDDVKWSALSVEARPTLYFVAGQSLPGAFFSGRSMYVTAKVDADPMMITPAVRSIVRELDPSLPILNMETMETVTRSSAARTLFIRTVLGLFAVVAVALGAIGIFGIVSYGVAQRRHEIGIRIALGAAADRVLRLVLKQGVGLTLLGVALGVVGALAGSRAIDGLLYGVTARDPVTYIAVALGMGFVAIVASLLPAIRASRTAPAEVLRTETSG